MVKKFNIDLKTSIIGKQFKGRALHSILEENIRNSGLRQVNPNNNRFKRQTVPILHGFRKFFTTQLVEADLKTELPWLLEGHNLKGNDMSYVRTTEKRLLEEYEKAIDNLTIDPGNRLLRENETLKVEKSRIDELEAKILELQKRHR